MKLPIKREYYEMIKSGQKVFEWREAHITFIDAATGERLGTHEVTRCAVVRNEVAKSNCFIQKVLKDWDELFQTEHIIQFKIKTEGG